jgi:hypothetical protein
MLSLAPRAQRELFLSYPETPKNSKAHAIAPSELGPIFAKTREFRIIHHRIRDITSGDLQIPEIADGDHDCRKNLPIREALRLLDFKSRSPL